MRAVILAIVAVACVVGVTAANAAAQTYGSGTSGLTLSRTTAAPGDAVSASGGGFVANSSVAITFESVPIALATVTAGNDGRIAVTVAVPTGATDGLHSIIATGSAPSNAILVLRGTLTVARSGSGNLVRTGASGAPFLVATAALFVALGWWVLVAQPLRRRRAPGPSSS